MGQMAQTPGFTRERFNPKFTSDSFCPYLVIPHKNREAGFWGDGLRLPDSLPSHHLWVSSIVGVRPGDGDSGKTYLRSYTAWLD